MLQRRCVTEICGVIRFVHERKSSVRALIVVSTLIGILPFSAAAQRRAKTMDEFMAYEKDFIHTFYPKLSGKKYWITFETSEGFEALPGYETAGKHFLVDIGDGPKSFTLMCCVGGSMGGVIGVPNSSPPDKDTGIPLIPATVPPPSPPHKIPVEKPLNVDATGAVHPYQYLSSSFYFDFQGRLTGFSRGERKEPEKLRDFWEQLHLHPNMTGKEITAAYNETGAKYVLGDRETFRHDLPIKQLENFLGKLKILKISFIDTGSEEVDKLDGFSFCRVYLEGPGKRQYVADFDGYSGELNLVHFLTKKDKEFLFKDVN